MLVLSRKVGERTMIGEMIVLTVLRVNGRRIRLGFEAPPDIIIRREELPPPREVDSSASTSRGTVKKPR